MLKDSDLADLRAEFDAMQKSDAFCADGSCVSGEDEIDLKDYPSYTEALYAQIVAPSVSGIYLSRWDIKEIANRAGDSMAIHPRKRMFELLMKFAVSQERMEAVLNVMAEHFEEKIAIYEELQEEFPHSEIVFSDKIEKAKRTVRAFPQILKEYF